MPVDFWICSLPRSGSTWAANWLTTDSTLCLHDPEASGMTLADIDANAEKIGNGKRLGVATTAAWAQVDWLNAHPAPKLVITRSLGDINRSLERLGLPTMEESHYRDLDEINGMGSAVQVNIADLFNPETAWRIAARLGVPFDADRHRVLSTFRVTPRAFR